MYRVQFFCPRQSPYWQTSTNAYNDWNAAVTWCQMVKPPRGSARVIDAMGRVLYQV